MPMLRTYRVSRTQTVEVRASAEIPDVITIAEAVFVGDVADSDPDGRMVTYTDPAISQVLIEALR